MNEPIPGRVYRHYKGTEYTVISTGHHSETLEEYVVYADRKTGAVWLRPVLGVGCGWYDLVYVNELRGIVPRFLDVTDEART